MCGIIILVAGIIRKEHLKLTLLIFLLPAVIGFFVFSGNEASSDILKKGISGSNNYFTSIIYSMSCIADNTAAINRVYEYLISFIRNGMFRVLIFAGIYIIAVCFTKYCSNFMEYYRTSSKKNNTILKLRI